MDFNEIMQNRRSVRDFEDKEVSTDLLKELVTTCTQAPNASNRQQWKFLIVNSKEMMKKISDASKAVMIAGIEGNPNSPMQGYLETLKNEEFNVFYNAPALVCFVGKIKQATVSMDCALAASYFMFSAVEKGLGTCWVAQGAEARDPDLLAELGMPEGFRIWAPIIVGYPKSIPPMPERNDPDILKIIE